DAAAPLGVGVFLERLGDDREPVVVEPVDQRAQGRELLLLRQRRIIEGAHQHAFAREELEQALVVDVELQALGGAIEVGSVDKKRNSLLGVEQHMASTQNRLLSKLVQNLMRR